YADGLGADLYIAIAPNKSTIYPLDMPGRYVADGKDDNIAILRNICEDLPVTWVDLVEPLKRAAGEQRVYYLTDTHWNQFGAHIAAEEILKATGARRVVSCEVTGQVNYTDGDLARLIGLRGKLRDVSPQLTPARQLPQADYDERYLTVQGDGEGTLLLLRDSFGTSVAPYLAQAYGQSRLRWETPFELTAPCDDIVILIAQRNIRLYLSEAPILPEYDVDEYLDEDEDDYDELQNLRGAFDDNDEGEYADDEDEAIGDDDEDDYEMLRSLREGFDEDN
ncbi:MAG: hypothetical protein Q4D04_14555, partial [Clostridia bacterium]|nr:hypothetical protein [Clostridia bacterium]